MSNLRPTGSLRARFTSDSDSIFRRLDLGRHARDVDAVARGARGEAMRCATVTFVEAAR